MGVVSNYQTYKMQVLIVLTAAVSMSMAAPNILTHQTTSFGKGPVISHGSVHNHAVAPVVAPVFQGGLAGHGVVGSGLVGHGLAGPGLVGRGLAGPGLAVARPGLAVGPAAVQPVAGGFVHF